MTKPIIPYTSVPQTYHPLIRELYRSKRNTLVYKVFDPQEGKQVRHAFRFDGYNLLSPKEIIERLGSKAAAEVQRKAWLIFPKGSHGNFLIYADPDDVKLESDNCLVYKSPKLKIVDSSGSVAVRSPNTTFDRSPNSQAIDSPFSQAINSPNTTFNKSKGCTSMDSMLAEFLSTIRSIINGSKKVKLEKCTDISVTSCHDINLLDSEGILLSDSGNIQIQNSSDLVIAGSTKSELIECLKSALDKCQSAVLKKCRGVKLALCKLIEVLDTENKSDLRNLSRRKITNGELVLRLYERIPFIGKLLQPSI